MAILAQLSISATWAYSNLAALYTSFDHNTVLPNPPIPLFRSQQANADASISQIGNPTPWNEALSHFKENLHKDLEKSLSVHFKETKNAKLYPLYFNYMKALDGRKESDF